jgi:transposase
MESSSISRDPAKSFFQVHAINAAEEMLVCRRSPFFTELPPCRLGLEACGTSHPGHALAKLSQDVRLMPPAYVKSYMRRGKTDANDAEATCGAVTREALRFVPVVSPEQQAALAVHRIRDLLTEQCTQFVED